MTARDFFVAEFQQVRTRLGGTTGLLTLAFLIALGALVPMKTGSAFIDPAYLVAYTAFAPIFAASWATQSFGADSEREFFANRTEHGATDRAVATGKVLASAVWGWVCWALILGAALGCLNSLTTETLLPPVVTLAGLAVFALAIAFFMACVSASMTLAVDSAAMARRLLRMACVFLFIVAVFGPRFFGFDTFAAVRGSLGWHSVGRTLLIASPVFVLIGVVMIRVVAGQLAVKREKLTILAE